MNIKEINYKPDGTIVQLLIVENTFIIQVLDRNDNIISELGTHDFNYAKKIYKNSTL